MAIGASRSSESGTPAPEQPDALNLLGVLMAATGRATEARGLLEQAAGLRPDDPNIHYNLGKLLTLEWDWAAAAACYGASLAIQPGNPHAQAGRGGALARLGRPAGYRHQFVAQRRWRTAGCRW